MHTTKEVIVPERLWRLYEVHSRNGVRLAYFLTGDLAAAEDIVHDAFVRIARRFGDLRQPERFEAYLHRTIVNLAKMHFRGRARARRFVDRESTLIPTQTDISSVEERLRLREAMLKLTFRQRTAIALRFYFDLPDVRSAEILGCSQATVRSLISRGLTRLRASLEEDQFSGGEQ